VQLQHLVVELVQQVLEQLPLLLQRFQSTQLYYHQAQLLGHFWYQTVPRVVQQELCIPLVVSQQVTVPCCQATH
jgi:hypothetical protein